MCVAAAIAGAAVVGAVGSNMAADKAAGAQESAANSANATQLQMYNQTRSDQAPWRGVGAEALNSLAGYYGLQPYSAQQADPQMQYGGAGLPTGFSGMLGDIYPNYPNSQTTAPQQAATPQAAPSGQDINKLVQNLPGYQFNFQQGQQAVDRNLAARGLLQSGAAGKALTEYGQGYASNAVQEYLNGLRSLSGVGQVSTQATGAAGANAANQIGSNDIYSGNAQASGYANSANAINSGLQGIVGAYGMYRNAAPAMPSFASDSSSSGGFGYNLNSASSPWSFSNLAGP